MTMLTDLDQVLRAGGVPFHEVPYSPIDPTGAPSWRERGRPASAGPFNPAGVLCHHTASPAGTTPAVDLNVILAGNSQAPGPIAQLYLGRDSQCYLVAAGRANHGGKGRRPGVDVGGCADMNALLVGIEVANDGIGERWPDSQTTLYAQVVAALLAGYGWTTADVYLHATTGPPNGGCNSKIDPAGPWQREPQCQGTWNLDTWRAFVDEHCGGGGSVAPPEPEGDDDVFIGTPLIQSTGKGDCFAANGEKYPAWPGALFLTDGRATTYRWLVTNQDVDDATAMLRAAGLPTGIQPVDNLGAYGVCIGPVPGS